MDDLHTLILDTEERLLAAWQTTWTHTATVAEASRLWAAIGETGLFGALSDTDADSPGSEPDFVFEFMVRWGRYLGPGVGIASLIGARALLHKTAMAGLLSGIADGSIRLALAVGGSQPGEFPDTAPSTNPDHQVIRLSDVAILRDVDFATHALLTGFIGPEPVIACVEVSDLALSATFALVDGSSAASLLTRDIVPSEHQLLWRGGAARAAWINATERMTAAAACEAVGVLRAILDQTANYIRQRKQFGQTIGSFQVVQHRMAEMLVDIEQAHSLALAAIRAPHDAPLVSAAKARINRSLQFVADQAVQLHGGIGTTQELPLSRYFRRAIVLAGEFGSTPAHLKRVEAGLALRISRSESIA
jgi:alkylation response protein AidB-like acyl-CoA dehydrogenase